MVDADLAEGDEVVTQGVQQLSDGATVRLLDAAPAPQGAGAGEADSANQRSAS